MGSRLHSRESRGCGRPTHPTPSHLLSPSPGRPAPALPHRLVTQVGPPRQVSWLLKAQQKQLLRSCPPHGAASWPSSGQATGAQDNLLPRYRPHCTSHPTSAMHAPCCRPSWSLTCTYKAPSAYVSVCEWGRFPSCVPILFHPVVTSQGRDRGSRRGRRCPGPTGARTGAGLRTISLPSTDSGPRHMFLRPCALISWASGVTMQGGDDRPGSSRPARVHGPHLSVTHRVLSKERPQGGGPRGLCSGPWPGSLPAPSGQGGEGNRRFNC